MIHLIYVWHHRLHKTAFVSVFDKELSCLSRLTEWRSCSRTWAQQAMNFIETSNYGALGYPPGMAGKFPII